MLSVPYFIILEVQQYSAENTPGPYKVMKTLQSPGPVMKKVLSIRTLTNASLLCLPQVITEGQLSMCEIRGFRNRELDGYGCLQKWLL